jgi:hypothetical protein
VTQGITATYSQQVQIMATKEMGHHLCCQTRAQDTRTPGRLREGRQEHAESALHPLCPLQSGRSHKHPQVAMRCCSVHMESLVSPELPVQCLEQGRAVEGC